MELFRIHKDIPFMRHALVFNVISLVTFIIAVFFLVHRGLNLSVEFTGGTVIEITYAAPPQVDSIRDTLAKAGFPDAQAQSFGSASNIRILIPPRAKENSSRLANEAFGNLCQANAGSVKDLAFKTDQGETKTRQTCSLAGDKDLFHVRSVEFVGPQVGSELATDGAMAMLVVIIGIMIYLSIRFEWRFAVSGIIANLHDVVIILGCFAFFRWEFSLPVLAAVLAVLGYSVNESVIVFDRVRETFRNSRMRGLTVPQVLDHAITRTISRTIITHGCTQMMVLSMLFFGGPSLHYFAVALTIGICFGIYSSVLVASPLVMWMRVSREQFVKVTTKKEEAVV
jgi:preprotein translocase subunit SecF